MRTLILFSLALSLAAAPTKLIVDGDEGSHLIGTTELPEIRVRTILGEQTLALADIREVSLRNDVTTIALADGKRIAGELLIESITITTIVGDITVPHKHIRRIQVLSGNVFDGLILRYSFDDDEGTTISDAHGELDAKAKGSSALAEGRIGGARTFNGEPHHLILPEASISGMRAGSVACWVRLPKPTNQQIFNRCVKEDNIHFQFRTGDRGNLAAFLGPYENSPTIRATDATIPANTWTFIALTWSGSEAHLYQNGKRVAHMEDPEERLLIPLIQGSFWIGRDTRKAYPGQTLTGDLDEFMIFSHTLSELDIQGLYAYFTDK